MTVGNRLGEGMLHRVREEEVVAAVSGTTELVPIDSVRPEQT